MGSHRVRNNAAESKQVFEPNLHCCVRLNCTFLAEKDQSEDAKGR